MKNLSIESYYQKIYSGELIVIKLSGKVVEHEDFLIFVDQVKHLISKGLKFIIVFGGGNQIDKYLTKNGILGERKKIYGIGVTTKTELEKGVIPAYNSIVEALKCYFCEIQCDYISPFSVNLSYRNLNKYGEVGSIGNIELLSELSPITFIGFMGTCGNNFLNVNADEVCRGVVLQLGDTISKVILISDLPGLLDINGDAVLLVLKNTIGKIIAGEKKQIRVKGGMINKIREIAKLLEVYPKVVLTDLLSLQGEIMTWKGLGTMFIRDESIEFGLLCESLDKYLFKKIYQVGITAGFFRTRTATEFEVIEKYHYVIRVGKSILGGVSLVPYEGDYYELSVLWSGYIGNKLGKMIIEFAKEIAKGDKKIIFALTTKEEVGRFLIKMGFTKLGVVSKLKGTLEGDLGRFVDEYTVGTNESCILQWKSNYN